MISDKDVKKVALVIASKGFKDEEYFITKQTLEKSGLRILTTSNDPEIAIGSEGARVKVDFPLEDLHIEKFDAIVFIGGEGVIDCLDNERSYKIAQNTIKKNKVLAAICIAPVILAKAGVLKNRKSTVWSGRLNKVPIAILKENGAIYEGGDVVIDSKIITANGPEAAEEFGKSIVRALE